jgi:hypothetical protein
MNVRPEKFFTTLWRRDTWVYHRSTIDGIPLDHCASEQYTHKKISIGDTIYIFHVSSPEGKLFLGGKIKVAWIGTLEEARAKLGVYDLWEASYHVIGNEDESLPMIFDLDVTDIANQLRFISDTDKDRLVVDRGRVCYFQLRKVRELISESAQILDKCLVEGLQRASVRTLRKQISYWKTAQRLQNWWPLEYNDFFCLWVQINNLYNGYPGDSEPKRLKAFSEDVEKQIQLTTTWKVSCNFLSSPFLRSQHYHQGDSWVLNSLADLKVGRGNLFDLLRLVYRLRCNLFHGDTISIANSEINESLELVKLSIEVLRGFLDDLFTAQL